MAKGLWLVEMLSNDPPGQGTTCLKPLKPGVGKMEEVSEDGRWLTCATMQKNSRGSKHMKI